MKLADIQSEIQRQMTRDFGEKSFEDVKHMVFLGLVEEAGEVAGLMKRVLRDFPKDRKRATPEHFIEEMGDVLWYLTACCIVSGTSLDELWEYNLKKLKERYGE